MSDSKGRETHCLFCGATDITKEHVLPKWLSQTLKEGVGTGDIEQKNFTVKTDRGEWTAGIMNLEVRTFCGKNCNSGWMSDLEVRAKPVLSMLALAKHAKVVFPDTQALLATWAYKTLLTLIAWHDPDLIGRAEYERFHETQTPGPATLISMGAYSGSEWVSRFTMEGHDLVPDRGRILDAPYDTITAFFNIFRSVFTIFRWMGLDPIRGEDTSDPDDPGHFGRIWPVTTPFLRVPPGPALTEEEYSTFRITASTD